MDMEDMEAMDMDGMEEMDQEQYQMDGEMADEMGMGKFYCFK